MKKDNIGPGRCQLTWLLEEHCAHCLGHTASWEEEDDE